MINNFGRLAGPEPYAYAQENLSRVLEDTFAEMEILVPQGTGDRRRPAGALAASGHFKSLAEGTDYWSGEIKFGEAGPDPAVNYAVWSRWKHLKNTGVDWFGDPIESSGPAFEKALNSAFDEVFPDHGDI